MAQRFTSSFCTAFLVAASALAFASCGIEAAEQPQSKTPAEQIAERFAGRTDQTPAPTEDQNVAAAAKASEAKRIAAAKREEKARKASAEAAAAKAEAERVAAQLKADEEEMLALAKAEADQRRAALETERQEQEKSDATRIAEDKAAEEIKAKAIAEAEARKLANDARAAEERRIAEEKSAAEAKAMSIAEADARKRADEARVAEERRRADEKAKAIAEAEAKAKARIAADAEAQEKLRAAELQRLAEREQAEQDSRAAELKILQARRQEESRQLAERLAAAAAAQQAKLAATRIEVTNAQQPSSASMPLMAVPGPKPSPVSRATVLVVMEAGSTGIRRFEKSADPVLCTRTGCYISAGSSAPAKFVAMAKALGPSGTLGERAGACKHSLTCIFRDVDLTASLGYLQPVDMKIMRHDRRESHIVTADSECLLAHDRLACRRPIVAAGYRMWVLQEGFATLAGPDALETALRDGLPLPPKAQNAGLDQ